MSSNNNQGMPSIQEEWLENQLVFGKPSNKPTKVTYRKTCSFDRHISSTEQPAILKVTSTTTHQNSLSSSFESESSTDNKLVKEKRNTEELSHKISKQSLKHLETWNKVNFESEYNYEVLCQHWQNHSAVISSRQGFSLAIV